jgi:RNA polymerase sigma-70 factor (ECF subfamily)
MPDRDRALLVLTALEGYSTVAAAEALGITAGAARVRLHRLRARLREAYAATPPRVPAAGDGGVS